MSVIIKGINVPRSCYECEWIHNDECVFTGAWVGDLEDERAYNCPVSAERRGHWEKDSDTAFYWKCSECGAYLLWRKEEYLLRAEDEPNYCPNCGTRMEE